MGRRTSPPAGWLKLFFALTLPLVSTAAAACPLCYAAARQMMTEGVQLDSTDRAVLAARDEASGPLRIVAVVKGSDRLGDAIAEPVTEAAEAASVAGEPSLLIHDPTAPQWTSLGTIPLKDADWLRRIVATREVAGDRPPRTWPLTMSTADALSYAGWRQRVALVAHYVENANSLAARLAWGELARAPYATLDAARSQVGPASIEAWLDDPKLAPRRAAYLTLLGFVGGPEDGARLDRRIETALSSHDSTDLAAMIAADLALGGPTRIDWISARIFADRKSTMPEIEATLLALNVLGDANSSVPRAQVVAAYREFIKLRPPMGPGSSHPNWPTGAAGTRRRTMLQSSNRRLKSIPRRSSPSSTTSNEPPRLGWLYNSLIMTLQALNFTLALSLVWGR